MSELSDAFAELAEAKREVSDGADDSVILDGQKIRLCLVEEISSDETLLSGGIGDLGQFRVHIPCSEVADEPARGLPIEVRGKQLEVLSSIERNGVTYEITAGDLATEADND